MVQLGLHIQSKEKFNISETSVTPMAVVSVLCNLQVYCTRRVRQQAPRIIYE